jgi:uncharacterized membrane protein
MFPYLIAPLIIIAVALPMVLGIVPPNGIYGFRTPYTMSSDDVWYRANRISGIALVVSGAMWIALVLLLPKFLLGDQDPLHWAGWLAFGSLLLAVAVSLWLVYRRRAE